MGLFLRTYFEEQASLMRSSNIGMDSFFRAAHDLRSPLSAVNLTLHHLKKTNPQLDHIALLDEAVHRINKIAEEILHARKQNQAKPIESLDLVEAVKSFAHEAHVQTNGTMELIGFTRDPGYEVRVLGNKPDLHRILWNLLQNANEANASSMALSWEVNPKQITLKVQNNGIGIPPQTLEKVGQDGFTTKKNGNGLGIYGAIKTMQSWQGDLKVLSQNQFGTTIELIFTST